MPAKRRSPAEVDLDHGYCAGMDDALKRLRDGEQRAPTEDDRPPPSIFPITRAARAALDYAKQRGRA